MNTLLDRTQTSSTAPSAKPREAIATGFLIDAVFGTNAGLTMRSLASEVFGVTTVPASQEQEATMTVAEEVRQLRDTVCAVGISRKMIAKMLSVDRRSLSGWASGEIRPAPERLSALRMLARIAVEIDTDHPGRAADVVNASRGSTALVDAVASGHTRLESWRSWLARSAAEVTVTARRPTRDPMWANAARAVAEGRLTAPTWERSLWPESTYEMRPDEEAGAFAEPEYQSGRPDYR